MGRDMSIEAKGNIKAICYDEWDGWKAIVCRQCDRKLWAWSYWILRLKSS